MSAAGLADVIAGKVSIGTALGMTTEDLARIVELGRAHLAAGRAQDARKVFDGLCALEPDVATFHELSGLAAEAQGDLLAADAALTAAVHRAGDHARGPVYVARALVRMKRGHNEAALADFALAGELCDKGDPLLQKTIEVMGARCAALVAGPA